MILKVFLDNNESQFFVEEDYERTIGKCYEFCTVGVLFQIQGHERKMFYPSHRIKEIELIEEK